MEFKVKGWSAFCMKLNEGRLIFNALSTIFSVCWFLRRWESTLNILCKILLEMFLREVMLIVSKKRWIIFYPSLLDRSSVTSLVLNFFIRLISLLKRYRSSSTNFSGDTSNIFTKSDILTSSRLRMLSSLVCFSCSLKLMIYSMTYWYSILKCIFLK